MKKKVVAFWFLASAFVIAAVSGGAYASSSYGETEIAGASKMIENYYYSQTDSVDYSDPEAVVPFSYDNTETNETADANRVADASATDNGVAGANVAATSTEQTETVVSAGVDTLAGASVVAEPAVATDTTVATDGAIAVAEDPAAVQTEAVPEATAAPTPEPVSEYADIGISIANEYVHIRRRPTTESKILGKLYRGSAAKILKTVGDWVKIKSGSVQGYIKSEYLAIGFDAEELVDKYGTKIATVMTETLYVREERNTDCTVLTLVSEDEQLEVTKEYDDWCKVIVDEDTKGYVAKEYVDIDVHFKKAISIEEEKEQLRLQKEREEAIRRQEAEAAAAARRAAYSSSSGSSSRSSGSSSRLSGNSYKSSGSLQGSSAGNGTGSDAASYAQNFVGNPYSYGGTSLTNGTDCSGFVQSVYKKYGISLPRTSSSQSGTGSKVDLDNLQKGDLVFYSSGGHVNHVAIYVGDGKVVHASNKREGIKTSKVNYRKPSSARRVTK